MVVNGNTLLDAQPIHRMKKQKFYENNVSFGLGEAGYDIRIKQEIHFTRDFFLRRCVQRTTHAEELCGFADQPHEQVRESGNFVLASSVERFRMPRNLMGIVHDKSSWARKGLSVFNTVIEPGWNGFLTLELAYHGWRDLFIPAGTGIAQVIFHRLAEPAEYTGRYQNQEDAPVSAQNVSSGQASILDVLTGKASVPV